MLDTSLAAKKCQEIRPSNILSPFIWEKGGRAGIDLVTTASQKKPKSSVTQINPQEKVFVHEDERVSPIPALMKPIFVTITCRIWICSFSSFSLSPKENVYIEVVTHIQFPPPKSHRNAARELKPPRLPCLQPSTPAGRPRLSFSIQE